MKKFQLFSLMALVATSSQAEFRPLPDLGAGGTAYDVNNAGVIVGAVANPDDHQLRPAAWQGGILNALALGTFDAAFATAISADGRVVGSAFVGHQTTPVAWQNGQIVALPTLGEGGGASDVNSAGTIVGYVNQGSQTLPAVWVNGELRLLPYPTIGDTGSTLMARANSINELGEIAGSVEVAFGSDKKALRWRNFELDNPLLDAFLETRAAAITNDLSVLFRGYEADGSTVTAGLIKADGTIQRFDRGPKSITVVPTSAAGNGYATGYELEFDQELGINYLRPVRWQNGVRTELDLPTPNRWGVPIGINDSGLAVGHVSDAVSGRSTPGQWDLQTTQEPGLAMPAAVGTPGQTIQLVATYRPNGRAQAGRSVRFLVGTTQVGSATTDSTGTARVNYTVPAGQNPGRFEMMCSLGGSRYTRSTLQVNAAVTALTARATVAAPGGSTTITGTLRNTSLNRLMAGQRVTVVLGGVTRHATTLTNGTFRLTVPISSSVRRGTNHQAQVRFAGNSNHNAVQTVAVVPVR